MRVSIIGTGYVGLVTGVCLAEKGQQVICVDSDAAKVSTIQRGIPPIHEAGLEDLLRKNLAETFSVTTDLEAAVRDSNVTLIAVGTPSNEGEIDLRFVREVSTQIGAALKRKDSYHVVVLKSTVVPGTTEDVALPLLEKASRKRAGRDFGVGVNPEFLTEGEAVRDFLFPDRIVLGALDDRSLQLLEELYAGFEGVDFVRTNLKTAEMIKYASNCLLATMISFSNELGNLCAALGGTDVADVLKAVHLSKYLTTRMPGGDKIAPDIVSFLWPGCGFGGSCLPKDVLALAAHGRKAGLAMALLDAVLQVNQDQPGETLKLLRKHFSSLKGTRVAVLGLAFRPETNDMRESPAIPILRQLLEEGAVLRVYDPAAMEDARKIFPNGGVRFCSGVEDAVRDSDAVILVTRWKEFEQLPTLLRRMNPSPLLVDGRRFLDKASLPRYEGIGYSPRS